MRIPIYEELTIEDFSLENLRQTFNDCKVGLIPMYSSFHGLSPKERPIAAMNIEVALKELDIYPFYPYPFYIISETAIRGITISVFSKVEDLPSHYFKKAKRLKNKELLLLNKTTLLAEKVFNNDLYQKEDILKEGYANQKELYRKSKELNFYENILWDLNEQDK
ncbi:hypothetical protein A9Q84_12560 [Halobacteriovorax marinus]|uniref:Uncharacterized protein n=1 Tax=Halobacteriovorax marinus TaxID=97084 RepID=A0A1Y5FEY8_9BACT|nr:hypothetical protein A9Q84_12560 [Halobacteriovorax marinus]